MKRTKKYEAALTAYRSETRAKLKAELDNAKLYEWLEKRLWWWNASEGKWQKGNKPSNSIFATDDDVASGVIRLRVMAHPDDVETAVVKVKKTPGIRVIDISEPYENRKGAGVRIYLTAVLDTQ